MERAAPGSQDTWLALDQSRHFSGFFVCKVRGLWSPSPFWLESYLVPGVAGRKTLLRRVGCFCCLRSLFQRGGPRVDISAESSPWGQAEGSDVTAGPQTSLLFSGPSCLCEVRL